MVNQEHSSKGRNSGGVCKAGQIVVRFDIWESTDSKGKSLIEISASMGLLYTA